MTAEHVPVSGRCGSPFPSSSDFALAPLRDGFTLLEVLVVLALLLFGLGVVAELMNGSARQASDSEERTEVQLACQNTLNEIACGARPVVPGSVLTIPSLPHWTMQILVEELSLPGVVAIKLLAQKYESTQQVPVAVKQVVFKQWMARASIRYFEESSATGDSDPFSFQPARAYDDLFRDAGFTPLREDEARQEETPK